MFVVWCCKEGMPALGKLAGPKGWVSATRGGFFVFAGRLAAWRWAMDTLPGGVWQIEKCDSQVVIACENV